MAPQHPSPTGRTSTPQDATGRDTTRSARHHGRFTQEKAQSAQRAELASYSVTKLFVHRLLGVPGTLIGETSMPPTKNVKDKLTRWNYWWQAHLLDAMVDAGFRDLHAQRESDAKRWLDNAHRLLRGIRWHNAGTYANSYYDDMAWLTLACQRLNALSQEVTGHGSAQAQEAGRDLYPRLRAALTEDLGGGAFWNTAADFKNVPATAPIALALARAGAPEESTGLLGWLREHLFDVERGYLDGIRLALQRDGSRTAITEEALHSYNQGTVLGALLETPGADLEHAEELIRLIGERFTTEVEAEGITVRILDTRGGGDGGLFAGILARYLAEAAQDTRLAPRSRATARELVVATAEMLWAGRREFDPDLPLNEPGVDVTEIRGRAVALFSPDAARHSSQTLGAGTRVELSSQVQAWTILEAAYRLS